jgi:hypothetical protein
MIIITGGRAMNYFSDRKNIPLRPDPKAKHEALRASLAKAAVYLARNVGKAPEERSERLDDKLAERLITRTSVTPTRISDATGIAGIGYEIVAALVAQSASGALIDRSLKLNFDNRAQISVPSIALSDATWVGESQPIGVQQGSTTAGATLLPYKLATIIPFSFEMLTQTGIEQMAEALLLESIAPVIDKNLFGNAAAVANKNPAGLLNGISAITASAASGIDALTADLQSIARALAPLASSSDPIIVAAPEQYSALTTRPVAVPFEFFQSNALAAGEIIGIVPKGICTVIGMPSIEEAPAHVHMDSAALALVSESPVTISAPSRSGFQTDSVMLRFILPCTWAPRSASAVCYITGCKW